MLSSSENSLSENVPMCAVAAKAVQMRMCVPKVVERLLSKKRSIRTIWNDDIQN